MSEINKANQPSEELSDEALESVAGGTADLSKLEQTAGAANSGIGAASAVNVGVNTQVDVGSLLSDFTHRKA